MAQVLEDFDAAYLGHDQIENDECVRTFGKQRERLAAVLRGIDGEAFAPQDLGDERSNGQIVIRHECAGLGSEIGHPLAESLRIRNGRGHLEWTLEKHGRARITSRPWQAY